MKADPSALLKLLDVQTLDSKADQVRHQLRTLPELAQISETQQFRKAIDDQRRDQQIKVDDLSADQAKVDADVEVVKARRLRDRDRMDKGLIADPKALDKMTHELESLDRRIASLEDDEIEVMEALEQAKDILDSLQTQLAEADQKLSKLATARDEKAGVLQEQLADAVAERAQLAEGFPTDLLALYERLREAKGGVGAAMLHRGACQGCQLSLDNAELARVRAAGDDEVVRCDDCGRILVRTSESGL